MLCGGIGHMPLQMQPREDAGLAIAVFGRGECHTAVHDANIRRPCHITSLV